MDKAVTFIALITRAVHYLRYVNHEFGGQRVTFYTFNLLTDHAQKAFIIWSVATFAILVLTLDIDPWGQRSLLASTAFCLLCLYYDHWFMVVIALLTCPQFLSMFSAVDCRLGSRFRTVVRAVRDYAYRVSVWTDADQTPQRVRDRPADDGGNNVR